jgi:hypothetical protein
LVIATRSIQICETADVVDLERSLFGAAMLAFLGKETLDDLTADAAVDSGRTVAQDRILFPCQRDAAEHGHKWLLALTPLPCDDQGRLGASSILHLHSQSTIDRGDLRLVLVGEGAEE